MIMLNMYFSVMNCSTGFPEVAAIKLIPFRELGTIDQAVNECIDAFDKFSDAYSGTAPFAEHKQALIEMAAQIQHKEQIISGTVSFRRDTGKLVQRILSVSVRTGTDLPTKRN